MLPSPDSLVTPVTLESAGERRLERVARSIWRLVCWCINLSGRGGLAYGYGRKVESLCVGIGCRQLCREVMWEHTLNKS